MKCASDRENERVWWEMKPTPNYQVEHHFSTILWRRLQMTLVFVFFFYPLRSAEQLVSFEGMGASQKDWKEKRAKIFHHSVLTLNFRVTLDRHRISFQLPTSPLTYKHHPKKKTRAQLCQNVVELCWHSRLWKKSKNMNHRRWSWIVKYVHGACKHM